MKRITVTILCMLVNSDGDPVDGDGEVIEGDKLPYFEWDKRRMAASKFCYHDRRNPALRTVHYIREVDATPMKCSCHQKLRLVCQN